MAYPPAHAPDPVLTDVAFRFRMPDGEPLSIRRSLRGSNLSSAVTSAQEEARTEALRRQTTADYPRPTR